LTHPSFLGVALKFFVHMAPDLKILSHSFKTQLSSKGTAWTTPVCESSATKFLEMSCRKMSCHGGMWWK